jgi:hypothetical protein
VVIVLEQAFVYQYSCLAESKSLVIKSCSVEEVHFQVVKYVKVLFMCIQSPTQNA